MKVAIRTDASLFIGTGHVVRCKTLADELRGRGAEVRFICREHPGHMIPLLRDAGYSVAVLPAPANSIATTRPSPDDYAAWLGVGQSEDAAQTLEALSDYMPDWLVVDHYGLDIAWECLLRPKVGRILAIDDLADRPHDCDLLLDQNLFTDAAARHNGKVPEHCRLMLGPDYALLHGEYAELHSRIPPREGQVKRILVFFGNTDAAASLTSRAIAAFLQLNRPDIVLDVVVSTSCPHFEFIRAQVQEIENIALCSNLPSLASLIARADLAIGAGGVTTWERCCLGLPALVITLAENQRPIAEELQARGLIRWLGHSDEVTQEAIHRALSEILTKGITGQWSNDCRTLVDGLGTKRVCVALTASADMPLNLRHANLDDETILLRWANDSVVRQNAFTPESISIETHRYWFRSRLRDLINVRLYVVETDEGIPVGQVRFERGKEGWEISYSLDALFRGLGLGRRILQEGIQKLRSEMQGVLVFGRVKAGNRASRHVFESLNFEPGLSEGGAICYVLRSALTPTAGSIKPCRN